MSSDASVPMTAAVVGLFNDSFDLSTTSMPAIHNMTGGLQITMSTGKIVIYAFAYSCAFIVGLVGNLALIFVIIRTLQWRKAINFFLINLAVSDLMICLVCLPATLMVGLYSPQWPLGALMCKLVPYLQGISVFASVNTLAAIAVDRVLAICHGYKMSFKISVVAQAIIWSLGIILISPWAFFYDYTYIPATQRHICGQFWPKPEVDERNFFIFAFLTCYALPLLAITLSYIRISIKVHRRGRLFGLHRPEAHNIVIRQTNRRVLRLVVTITVVFAFSWLPLWTIYFIYYSKHFSTTVFHAIVFILPITQWLGLANSCFNPIIYFALNRDFKSRLGQELSRVISTSGNLRPAGRINSNVCELEFEHSRSNVRQRMALRPVGSCPSPSPLLIVGSDEDQNHTGNNERTLAFSASGKSQRPRSILKVHADIETPSTITTPTTNSIPLNL